MRAVIYCSDQASGPQAGAAYTAGDVTGASLGVAATYPAPDAHKAWRRFCPCPCWAAKPRRHPELAYAVGGRLYSRSTWYLRRRGSRQQFLAQLHTAWDLDWNTLQRNAHPGDRYALHERGASAQGVRRQGEEYVGLRPRARASSMYKCHAEVFGSDAQLF